MSKKESVKRRVLIRNTSASTFVTYVNLNKDMADMLLGGPGAEIELVPHPDGILLRRCDR